MTNKLQDCEDRIKCEEGLISALEECDSTNPLLEEARDELLKLQVQRGMLMIEVGQKQRG